VLDARGRLLRAALGFVIRRAAPDPALHALHRWLDSRHGIGAVAVGMHHQGWDLQLTEYGGGHWRATFYVTDQAHSIVGGSAREATPWRRSGRRETRSQVTHTGDSGHSEPIDCARGLRGSASSGRRQVVVPEVDVDAIPRLGRLTPQFASFEPDAVAVLWLVAEAAAPVVVEHPDPMVDNNRAPLAARVPWPPGGQSGGCSA
jgi:hypothetical protein